jgi:hypothetical protein
MGFSLQCGVDDLSLVDGGREQYFKFLYLGCAVVTDFYMNTDCFSQIFIPGDFVF